ncbi:hypothetical protein IGI47_000881 [Enterococcus sp. AZ191]
MYRTLGKSLRQYKKSGCIYDDLHGFGGIYGSHAPFFDGKDT